MVRINYSFDFHIVITTDYFTNTIVLLLVLSSSSSFAGLPLKKPKVSKEVSTTPTPILPRRSLRGSTGQSR